MNAQFIGPIYLVEGSFNHSNYSIVVCVFALRKWLSFFVRHACVVRRCWRIFNSIFDWVQAKTTARNVRSYANMINKTIPMERILIEREFKNGHVNSVQSCIRSKISLYITRYEWHFTLMFFDKRRKKKMKSEKKRTTRSTIISKKRNKKSRKRRREKRTHHKNKNDSNT